MIAWVRWILVLGLPWFTLAGAWAGEPAATVGPKSAEFDQLFNQWKAVLEDLRRLRDEYRVAPPGRPEKRKEMQQRYNELLRKGEEMLPGLRAAAEAAFLETQAADSYPAEFLETAVYQDCERDSYEPAFRAAKLLLEHGRNRTPFYGAAGIAAFAACDFDLAEKWLRIAQQNNVFAHYDPPWSVIGPMALRVCPSFRQSWQKEEVIRAAEARADKSPEKWLPRVLLRTTKGDIELELFENEAPNTVANFIALVEAGFFKALGTPFYRVLKAQRAEAGGVVTPDKQVHSYDLYGCDEPNRDHFRGSVTMTAPADGHGGGTSQCSILFSPLQNVGGKLQSLNGTHTCFGRVVHGMEVLSRLQRTDPEHFAEFEPDRILDAKILRKRNHAYELRKPPAEKPKPEVKAGPKPEAKAGPKPEAKAGPKPEAKVGPKPEAKAGPKPKA